MAKSRYDNYTIPDGYRELEEGEIMLDTDFIVLDEKGTLEPKRMDLGQPYNAQWQAATVRKI